MSTGQQLLDLSKRLYPINRSLTGDGVRQSLAILNEVVPLKVYEIPTGKSVFDWEIPPEWNVRTAYVSDSTGNKVIDFERHNLHLVGYSAPVDRRMDLAELDKHLHSLPEQPDAIPYITSYYSHDWGFCLAHNDRLALKEDNYRVFIDSELAPGVLNIGECILPGKSDREVLLSTYICHPSMANNELSGPVITAMIAKWLKSRNRKYTYRIVFLPETIGSITYISLNLATLSSKVLAGFNLSCLGDDRCYSMVESRYGDTIADRIAQRTLTKRAERGENTIRYSFLDRQSDERQYCSPGVDLPLVTLTRSRFGTFPEYHTSLDNFELVTETGLQGGFEYVQDCLLDLEEQPRYKALYCCEPRLGKRGLYPEVGSRSSGAQTVSDTLMDSLNVRTVLDVVAYSDGTNCAKDLADRLNRPVEEIHSIISRLVDEGLLVEI